MLEIVKTPPTSAEVATVAAPRPTTQPGPGLATSGFAFDACVCLTPLAPEARWCLRLPEADAHDIGDLSGFDLSAPMNSARPVVTDASDDAGDTAARAVAASRQRCFRIGPDEWLLNASDAERDDLTVKMERTLANRPHALVDISDRNRAYHLAGPRAAEVLNSGCPLDLAIAVFAPGMATRTLYAHADIILHRVGEEVFEVQVWRSFSAYLAEALFVTSRLANAAAAERSKSAPKYSVE
ncbi:MAG: sarcosine oxidase subunit gamma family protein [Pseudomonadota bacterium]